MSDELKPDLVVADVYKLSRIGNKFTDNLKMAQIKFKKHTIDRAYCEEMNARWGVTGTWCVIDEEASEQNAMDILEKAAIRLENDKARETASRAVVSLALGANKANPVSEGANDELKEARAELKTLTGKVTYHKWDLETVLGKINELTIKN
jgi:hypothetical protein